MEQKFKKQRQILICLNIPISNFAWVFSERVSWFQSVIIYLGLDGSIFHKVFLVRIGMLWTLLPFSTLKLGNNCPVNVYHLSRQNTERQNCQIQLFWTSISGISMKTLTVLVFRILFKPLILFFFLQVQKTLSPQNTLSMEQSHSVGGSVLAAQASW